MSAMVTIIQGEGLRLGVIRVTAAICLLLFLGAIGAGR